MNTMPREIERRMPGSITEDHWLDLLYLMENVHAKNFTDLLRVFQQYETPKVKRRRVYGVDAKAIVDREMKENDPGSYYKQRLVEESEARKKLQSTVDSLQTTSTLLHQHNHSLEKRLEREREKRASLNGTLTDGEHAMKKKIKELEKKLKSQSAELEKLQNATKNEVVALQNEIQAFKAQKESKIRGLEAELKKIRSEKRTLVTSYNSLMESHAQDAEKLGLLKKELQKQVLDKANCTIKDENRKLKEQLEKTTKDMQFKIDKLVATVEDKNRLLFKLNIEHPAEIALLKEKYKQLATADATETLQLKAKMTDLEFECEKRVEWLKLQLDDAKADSQKYKVESQIHLASNNKLKSEMVLLQSRHDEQLQQMRWSEKKTKHLHEVDLQQIRKETDSSKAKVLELEGTLASYLKSKSPIMSRMSKK